MNKDENIKTGYWSIATQKHLKEFKVDSPNFDELDKLNIAGKTGRFLGAIRGNVSIENIKKLEKMAGLYGIQPTELQYIILPKLEEVSEGKVELVKDKTDNITGLREYIYTNEEVLGITGKLFEQQGPTDIQRIAIETMDATKKLPYYQNELIQVLCNEGFKEKDIELSFALQEQFKLVQRLNKVKRKDPIISNEYIWGANHEKIAMAISDISWDKKQDLKQIIDLVQRTQGFPSEQLTGFDKTLLLLAKKIGMLNPIKIISSRNISKEFEFCANISGADSYSDDILDDVKLLLASIRFGENYTQHSRLYDPGQFLRCLIKYGEVGPHDANASDYLLLEKKGIVKVVHKTKQKWSSYYNCYMDRTGYCLKLLRKDVAEIALKVIEGENYNLELKQTIDNFDAVNQEGTFMSAEAMRMRLADSPEYIKEAEEYLSGVLRDEIL